ncbi:MAG: trypsin-like peptidase domain-containing protein [Patescibacteria group bacterium]
MNRSLIRGVFGAGLILISLLFLGAASAHENEAVLALDVARNHLVKESMPAIYVIEVVGTIFDNTGAKITENIPLGLGTAFGVTPDGLVLTKMHILNMYIGKSSSIFVAPDTFRYEDGYSVKVSITLLGEDGTKYQTIIEGGDPNDLVDLALLKIVAPAKDLYPYLGIADATFGYDHVISIGHPNGFRFSVGEGIVSNPNAVRDKGDDSGRSYVQTTALVLPGSSGGPLIRVRDHMVVGMFDNLFSPIQGVAVGVGLGFATPASALKEFLQKELRRRTNTDR